MKKKVIQSILAVLLVFGMVNSTAFAAAAQPQKMIVTSIDLPVYSSFDALSGTSKQTHIADLDYNTPITVLSVKDYAAQIKMANGNIGWVHKAYLSSNVTDQTWLVKQGRNLRKNPTTASAKIGFVPDGAKVFVLGYDKASKFYNVKTADGKIGWIKGTYQADNGYDYNEGFNVIPYEFGKVGSVTTNISIFTPLNTVSHVSADQINKYILYKTNGKTTLMTGMGATYLKAESISGLNAVYLLAHSGLESKWGSSAIVSQKYNFYGIHAQDLQPMEGAYNYLTPTNGIIAGSIFISQTYVKRDQSKLAYPFAQPTLDNMRFNDGLHQYSTDEAWASKIANIIKEFNTFTYTGGWKNIAGKWYYNNGNGTYKTGWFKTGGKWYYFNASGVMQTGWQHISGKWYYLNSSGAMQTGWQLINSKWYYFYSDGHMAVNTKIGKYRLGKTGAMI